MPTIHPTAIIDPRAEIADDVRIDAHVVIEGRVIVGAGSHIKSHSILHGHTQLGINCKIGPAAYVGLDPAKDIRWVTSASPKPMELFADGKIDAFLGFPPEPQELRARKIGHVIFNSAVRPESA